MTSSEFNYSVICDSTKKTTMSYKDESIVFKIKCHFTLC